MPVYTLTDEDKEQLRETHGDVVEGEELINRLQEMDYRRLITVGDRVSLDIAESDVDADISIVDGRIEREAVEDGEHDVLDQDIVLTADNPAGQITEDAWNTVREAVAHTCSVTLHADGEEDLLALPAILFAAPDTVIVHGHWQEGAVILRPDDELTDWVRDLVGAGTHPEMIVGGSWDRFHAGHRYLLLAAFEHGEHVEIGVTADAMLADDEDADRIEPFEQRRDHIEDFLATFGLEDRADIVEIDDFRGTTMDADSALLLVTQETMENAKRINQERLDAGKTPLKLAVMDRITAEDGEPISSTRIRNGEIDRDGQLQ